MSYPKDLHSSPIVKNNCLRESEMASSDLICFTKKIAICCIYISEIVIFLVHVFIYCRRTGSKGVVRTLKVKLNRKSLH